MVWVVFIIAAIVAFIIYEVKVATPKQKEKNKEREELIEKWITERNINRSAVYTIEGPQFVWEQIKAYFIVDEPNEQIVLVGYHWHNQKFREDDKTGQLLQDETDIKLIPFKDLLGFEVLADGVVTGGIKRAIIGGAIAGDTGAVVGALTAKEKISSFQIVFYTNTISNPIIKMDIYAEEIKTDSWEYKSAKEFANRIDGTVRAILANKP